MLVSDVLITASAAAAEVWAFRRDALLDRRENFCELASANCFFSRTICAATRSPSIVNGTKTALPFARPTPLPPKATSWMCSSTGFIRQNCSAVYERLQR
jgi:hypothetical protein